MTLKVLVFSPTRLLADGIAQCLDETAGFAAESCWSVEQAMEALARESIDVLLFDISDADGMTIGSAIIAEFPKVKVIALALPEMLDLVIACADVGFVSYIPRNASLADLRSIVERADREEVICDPKVSSGLLRELHRRGGLRAAPGSDAALTPREHEVFSYMRQGLTNKEIARVLGISVATVKNHVHNLLGKTQLRSRAEAFDTRRPILAHRFGESSQGLRLPHDPPRAAADGTYSIRER